MAWVARAPTMADRTGRQHPARPDRRTHHAADRGRVGLGSQGFQPKATSPVLVDIAVQALAPLISFLSCTAPRKHLLRRRQIDLDKMPHWRRRSVLNDD